MPQSRQRGKAYLRGAIWLTALAVVVLLPRLDPAPAQSADIIVAQR